MLAVLFHIGVLLMFWPPTFRPNNVVTVDDAAYVVATAGEPRFASFVANVCFLSPWLARADQDTRWVTGDPMARVLFCGEVPDLRSFNEDAHGSCFQIGDPVLGMQRWEVVSYFDWYDAADGARKGIFAWARLTTDTIDDGGGGGGGGDPEPGDGENVLHFDMQTSVESEFVQHWTPSLGAIDADCYICIVLIYNEASTAVTSMSVDGTSLTYGDYTNDLMAPSRMVYYHGAISAGAGLVDIVFDSPGVKSFNLHSVQMQGVTGLVYADQDKETGGGSNPFADSGGSTTNAHNIIVAVVGSHAAGINVLTFDTPYDTNQAANLNAGGRYSRSSWIETTTTGTYAMIMGSITPADWISMLIVFN